MAKPCARHILDRRADYLLVLKPNQGNAYEAVQGYSDTHCFQRNAALRPVLDAFDDGHGRLVRRRVLGCPEAATLEHYILTVEDNGKQYTVRTLVPVEDPALLALIQAVRQWIKAARAIQR